MSNNIWALAGALMACLAYGSTAAMAQTCGGVYQVRPGDSLSMIADSQYKNARYWSAIHQNNIAKIGPSPDNLIVGMRLDLLCIDGLPVGLEGGVEAAAEAPVAAAGPVVVAGTGARVERINLVTGDDYAPFTDRKLPGGGMLAELVQRAMEEAAPAEGFAIHWVNDWDAHLGTLLEQGLVDMSFPWSRPACEILPDDYRCQTFVFSEPLFEILELGYFDTTRPMTFDTDSDMEGRTLCRVSGYSTHELDKDGRNWVKDGKIKLERPDKVGDCFQMLVDGKVDVVQIDEFAGKAALKEMGLTDRVQTLPRPISVEPLNVLIHKGNPRADELVKMIDTGLERLKEKGEYQQIVGTHLAQFWAEQ